MLSCVVVVSVLLRGSHAQVDETSVNSTGNDGNISESLWMDLGLLDFTEDPSLAADANSFFLTGSLWPTRPQVPAYHACQSTQNSVYRTALCMFCIHEALVGNLGPHGHSLRALFPWLANQDVLDFGSWHGHATISIHEWLNHFGDGLASRAIFTMVATQESKRHVVGDDSSSIDENDWYDFLDSMDRATPGRTDASEFANYVASRVAAERLFLLANSHGTWGHWKHGQKISRREFRDVFHRLNQNKGFWDGSIDEIEFARALHLERSDVALLFQFIEQIGKQSHRCWHPRDWWHGKPRISQCEWNTFGERLSGGRGGWRLGGISEGKFAEAAAYGSTRWFHNGLHAFSSVVDALRDCAYFHFRPAL